MAVLIIVLYVTVSLVLWWAFANWVQIYRFEKLSASTLIVEPS